MILKRIFDLLVSLLGLIILTPLFLLIAGLIKLDSNGPIFFRQARVGRNGDIFRIHKFRTMVSESDHQGLQITVGDDNRITKMGAFLRKCKIDELPQLVDVLAGNMSLVGPRPEVPIYIEYYPTKIRQVVLSVRPGITDYASIKYKDESTILGNAEDPHEVYINEILPIKQNLYIYYVRNQSFFGDIRIIFKTLINIFH